MSDGSYWDQDQKRPRFARFPGESRGERAGGGIGGGAKAALASKGIELRGGVSGNADEKAQARRFYIGQARVSWRYSVWGLSLIFPPLPNLKISDAARRK